VGFTLALVEGTLQVLDLYPPIDDPVLPAEPDLYESSPVFGYGLKPSRTVLHRYPPTSPDLIPLVSNSDGFRAHREFGGADPRYRILVVGDSFVFGAGVRAEERLTEQLEAMEPAWRVDNLGMGGWGLDLMMRALEHIAPKAKPDLVVLAVYTDDFRRLLPRYAGMGYAYDKFELVNGELKTVAFSYPAPWQRMRIIQALQKVAWRWDVNRYELNEALLNRYLGTARVMSFRPVVAFLPGRGDTAGDQERRAFLRAWSKTKGVAYLDLTDPIHARGVGKTYLRNNWHWNAEGHRIAAEQLRQLLLDLDVMSDPGQNIVSTAEEN
jgi:hypothetical protein